MGFYDSKEWQEEQWKKWWGNLKINLIILCCADCKKYRSFGNGYGECSIFRHTMKDNDFCSYAEWRDAGYDDHDHSGLIEE